MLLVMEMPSLRLHLGCLAVSAFIFLASFVALVRLLLQVCRLDSSLIEECGQAECDAHHNLLIRFLWSTARLEITTRAILFFIDWTFFIVSILLGTRHDLTDSRGSSELTLHCKVSRPGKVSKIKLDLAFDLLLRSSVTGIAWSEVRYA